MIVHFLREPLAYIKDGWNYFDMAGYALISLTFAFRFMESDLQWTFASFAFVFNSLGIFKYSVRDRYVTYNFGPIRYLDAFDRDKIG